MSFTGDDLAVALQHYLGRRPGLGAALRSGRLNEFVARELDQPGLLEQFAREMGLRETGSEPISHVESRERILAPLLAEYTAERARIGPDAPAMRIRQEPYDAPQPVVAVVFTAEAVLFIDALAALAEDAAGSGRTVVAVRDTWLDKGCRMVRAIAPDPGGPTDVQFASPAPVGTAWILHLAPPEHEKHRELSARLGRAGVTVVNPYHASRRLDDKAETHRLWRAAGVETPDWTLLPAGTDPVSARTIIADAMVRWGGAFILPNDGTEGRGVGRFTPSEVNEAASRAAVLLQDGPVLLRQPRGDVGFGSPPRAMTLRIHVAWNGTQWVAESGFAQVAPSPDEPVASRGRGGSIVSLQQALPPNIAPALADASERAAVALGPGPGVIGLDVLLERDGDRVRPVFLEANPRPAGLNHSEPLLTPSGQGPWITHALWLQLGG